MWTVVRHEDYYAFDVDKVYGTIRKSLYDHVQNIARYAKDHSDVRSYALDDTNGMKSDFIKCISDCLPAVLASMTSDAITNVVWELIIATRTAVYCARHAADVKAIPAGVLKAVLEKGHGVNMLNQMHRINSAAVVIQRKWRETY